MRGAAAPQYPGPYTGQGQYPPQGQGQGQQIPGQWGPPQQQGRSMRYA
jgi:hypothetical protein